MIKERAGLKTCSFFITLKMNIRSFSIFIFLSSACLVGTFPESFSRLGERFSLPPVTVVGRQERDLPPVALGFLPPLSRSSFAYLRLNQYYPISRRNIRYTIEDFSPPDFYAVANWQRGEKSEGELSSTNSGFSYGLLFSYSDCIGTVIDLDYPIIGNDYREYGLVYKNLADSSFSRSYSEISFKMQRQGSFLPYLVGVKPFFYLTNVGGLGGMEIWGYWGIRRPWIGLSGYSNLVSLSRRDGSVVFLYNQVAVNTSELWGNPFINLYHGENVVSPYSTSFPGNLFGVKFGFSYKWVTLGSAIDYSFGLLKFYPVLKLKYRLGEGWGIGGTVDYFNYLNRDVIESRIIESGGQLPEIYTDRGIDAKVNVSLESGLWSGSMLDLGYLWGDFLALDRRKMALFSGKLKVEIKNSPLSKIIFLSRLQVPLGSFEDFTWESVAYRLYGKYMYDFYNFSLRAIIGGGIESNLFYDEKNTDPFKVERNTLMVSLKLLSLRAMAGSYNYSIGLKGELNGFSDFFCTLSLGLRYNR